jgi:ubiquinone biosynthesis protein
MEGAVINFAAVVLARLLIIAWATFRFGLDEIAFARMERVGALWRAVFFWRRFAQPRGMRLRLALEYLGPIFVKFGQALSTRRDLLPADIAAELAKLQDQVAPEAPAKIRAALARAYGREPEEIFSSFDETPVGSASVAQVHRAVLLNGGGGEVAVKILRPGIRKVVRRDLRLLDACAWIAEHALKDGRRLKPRAVVGEFAKHLGEEMNLLHEAANCAQLRRNLASSDLVKIPRVYWPHCKPEVMAMEYLRGSPIGDAARLTSAGIDPAALARRGVELFFTQVFRDSFFHADMHPGNIHIDAEGRFILLDFGIVAQLSEFDKEYLARNFLAFFNRDYRAVAKMHVDAGWTPADTPLAEFETEIRAVCEPVFARPLAEISFGRFLMQMFQVARRFNLEVQPQLVLLQKTLLNVEGMGRDLAPELNLWDSAKPFLEKWAKAQYGPKRALSLLREQAPEITALAAEAPAQLRRLLRDAANAPARMRKDDEKLRRKIRRWQTAAVVAAAAAVFLWWRS